VKSRNRNGPQNFLALVDAAKQGNITLLYSAHDTEHNSALALKSYLEERLRG
jgi:uncharacterized protein YeaO (DUF488 family)